MVGEGLKEQVMSGEGERKPSGCLGKSVPCRGSGSVTLRGCLPGGFKAQQGKQLAGAREQGKVAANEVRGRDHRGPAPASAYPTAAATILFLLVS